MNNTRLLIVFAALLLLVAACGGKSAEEELLEQILENSGEDIGDVDLNLGDGDGDFNLNVTGDDGEDISITGGGDDEDFSITVEGEDGETMTFGGGDIPDGLDLPVADGGEVVSSLTSNDEMFVSLQYPGGDYDQLVSFYDSQLNAASDAVEKSETSFTTEDGTFRNVYYGPSNGDNWTVTIGDCMMGEPGICVTLIQGSS